MAPGYSLHCDACGRGTAPGVPCDPLPWLRPDLTTYPRQPYVATPTDPVCPDCGTPDGSCHHLPCWLQECEHGPWLRLPCDACRVDDRPEAA